MKIHQLRNATFVIESKKRFILVDPMLSDKGELLPFSFLKFKRENNPTVKLPDNAKKVLDQVTDCIVTHSQKWGIDFLTHKDHLDAKGIKFLKERNIKVATFHEDTQYIQGFGVKTIGFEHWEKKKYLDGNITFTPNKHGYCPTDKLMPKGSSVFLELAGEPSLMILGDTVLSNEVAYAIEELRPDIVVLPCGGEELDLGSPITMNLSEILSAISLCRGHVVANHMEALNNCPITREELAEAIKNARVTQTVHIPKDGETLEFGNNIKVPKKKTIKKPEVKPTKPIEEELMEGAQNLTKSIKKTIETKEELKEVTKIAKKATKDAKKKFDDISKVIKTTIEDSPMAPMKDEKKTTKAPAKKATATKTAAKKPASKSAKAPAKKAPAKKPASKSSSAKKAPAKKPAAKK